MDAIEKLIELDDRHNELLEQLAQLDKKVAATLNEWSNCPETVSHTALEDGALQAPALRIKAA
jgi:hypothetical protein